MRYTLDNVGFVLQFKADAVNANDSTSRPAESRPPVRVSPPVLIGAGVSSVSLLLFVTFLMDISDIVSVFLMPFAAIGFGVVFLGTLAWALYDALRERRYRHFTPFIPAMMHLAAALAAWLVPLGQMRSSVDFYRNLPQRQDVVNKIAEGELRPNVAYNPLLVRLPKDLRQLSRGGGEVAISRKRGITAVFFYVYRGTTSNTRGFMYRSDDALPRSGDCGIEFATVSPLQDHWFYVGP